MRTIILFLLFAFFATIHVKAQTKKIDTLASHGNQSYHVTCSNKDANENMVFVSPKGFGKDVRDISFPIKGKLLKILVDDFNSDGYPDLALCVYSGANNEMGNIASIITNGNNLLVPASFPDIYNNIKLSEGYKGHDQFSAMVGTLLQSFPIYKSGDTDTATGGTRVIQYGIMKNENGNLAFKVLRSYQK